MGTIHHQVWIDAPVSKVYEAVASAEGLGRWWTPHTCEQTEDGLVLMHSPGPDHGDVKMKVLELAPNRRVEWEIVSQHPGQSPASAWTGTHIAFDIETRDNPGRWRGIESRAPRMTVLEFRHSGWNEDSDFFGFCNYAWGVTLFMLAQWCEGKK